MRHAARALRAQGQGELVFSDGHDSFVVVQSKFTLTTSNAANAKLRKALKATALRVRTLHHTAQRTAHSAQRTQRTARTAHSAHSAQRAQRTAHTAHSAQRSTEKRDSD
jgi:hypothetical protein